MNPVTLETKRLFLVGLSPADMTWIFSNLSKPEIKEVLGHGSEEEYQKEEYKQRNGYSTYNRSFIMFMLKDKASNKIIGRCGLHNWNADFHRSEIGYSMSDESFKNKGLMTEALAAVLDYGFNSLNLNRIEAQVSSENGPSLRLMEKYTFLREGLLRQNHYHEGRYGDSVMFSKLREEYIADNSRSEE